MALPGVMVMVTGAVNETTALALLLGSAELVAVTVTLCALLIFLGALYRPPVEIVPTAGLSDQDTPVLAEPVTVAANC